MVLKENTNIKHVSENEVQLLHWPCLRHGSVTLTRIRFDNVRIFNMLNAYRKRLTPTRQETNEHEMSELHIP